VIGNTKPTLNQKYIRSVVKSAMLEDLSPHGDVTTQLIKSKKKFKAKIISNQKGIIGGLNFAKEAFKYFNKKINFITKTKDGRKINKGKVVATIVGNPKEILKSERVALNFLSLISGVATITNKFVSTVNGKSCRICCTRKTLPNLRLVQKYAVKWCLCQRFTDCCNTSRLWITVLLFFVCSLLLSRHMNMHKYLAKTLFINSKHIIK